MLVPVSDFLTPKTLVSVLDTRDTRKTGVGVGVGVSVGVGFSDTQYLGVTSVVGVSVGRS